MLCCSLQSSCIFLTLSLACLPFAASISNIVRKTSKSAPEEVTSNVEVSGAGPLKWLAPTPAHAETSAPHRMPIARRDSGSAGKSHTAEPKNNKSSKAQFSRRQRLAIPGHLAFPRQERRSLADKSAFPGFGWSSSSDETTSASGTGSGSGSSSKCDGECCARTFTKAANMVTDFMDSLAEDQRAPYLLMKEEIVNNDRGLELRGEFDLMLNHENGAAVKEGHMWDTDDQLFWFCCNALHYDPDKPCPALENHNEQGIIQGDIMTLEEHPGTGTSTQAMLLEAARTGKRWGGHLWPETSLAQHEIAYCYATSISDLARTAWDQAVSHLQAQVPCLRLKAVSTHSCDNALNGAVEECCSEFPSVIVQNQKTPISGCWSFIGQVSGMQDYMTSSQPINLDEGCEIMGIAAHEIGHALGLLHEMSRSDAYRYVTINEQNVNPDYLHNFQNNTAAFTGNSFDVLSLMMYGAYTFTTNDEVTIMPRDVRMIPLMGQRMGFSELDITQLGEMYGCSDSVTPLTENKLLSEAYLRGEGFEFEGLCVDQQNTGYLREGTTDEIMPCEELKIYCRHSEHGEDVQSKCPVSCYLCIPDETNTNVIVQNTEESDGPNTGGGDGDESSAEPLRLHTWILLSVALLLGASTRPLL